MVRPFFNWYHSGNKNAARFRELTHLTFPLLVDNIFIVLMNMINTAMVASLGREALSAAGHVSNASYILFALFTALTTGGTIVVAQAIGAGDEKKAAAAGGQAVTLTVIVSVLIVTGMLIFRLPLIELLFGESDPLMINFGLTYYVYIIGSYPLLAVIQTLFGVMRGSGDTTNPMKISLIMNGIAFALSFFLIIGIDFTFFGFTIKTPTFGMHGAGLAMAVARIAGIIHTGYVIKFRNKRIPLNRLSLFIPSRAIQKAILTLGVPTGVESTLFQVGRLFTQMFIIGMGTAAMAANTVANTIAGFIMVPGNAITISVMVLVGQRTGRREYDDIRGTTLFSVWACLGLIGFICLALLPATGLLINIYNLEGQSAYYFRLLFYSSLIATPLLWPLSFVTPSALRASGDVNFTMAAAVASMWACRIAMGYLLGVVLGWGVLGVWFGMYSDWVIRSLLFYVRLHRGKWKKKLLKLE